VSSNRKEAKWLPRDKDPEIEIAVLQMMDKLVNWVVRLAKSFAKVAQPRRMQVAVVPAAEQLPQLAFN
jgi:hypothetical protein